MLGHTPISDTDFNTIRSLLYSRAGITLADNKKALVGGRLHKRINASGCGDFSNYVRHISDPRNEAELRQAVDLLTTNETYFWRESQHFERLLVDARHAASERREFRAWSAACSSGEEPYTLAMVLQSLCDSGIRLNWDVFASDISERMLQIAAKGHYPLDRARNLPPELLRRYCLRGTGEHQGSLLVERSLRDLVRFAKINLVEGLPDIGRFDAVFLRNVMIYFDREVKSKVLASVCRTLKPGGHLYVGLSESLHGVVDFLEPVAPGVHRLRRST